MKTTADDRPPTAIKDMAAAIRERDTRIGELQAELAALKALEMEIVVLRQRLELLFQLQEQGLEDVRART
jgi:hypothetical protein